MKINLDALPSDISLLHELIRELAGQLERYENELRALRRHRFGRRSERFAEGQGRLAFFEEEESEPEPQPPPKDKPGGKKGHGRRKTPANLPEKKVDVEIPQDRKLCDKCNTPLVEIGREETRLLEYVPAVLHVIRYSRAKCSCPKCHDTVVTADIPYQPIKKGMHGPGLLAHILTSKYSDHIPLQRLKGMFARSRVSLNATTMCDWISAVVRMLAILYEAMKADVLSSNVVSTDATTITVRKGRKKGRHKGYLWAYLGDEEHPHVVFDYTARHNRDGPRSFLGTYEGYLQADAHSVYDHLFLDGRIVEVGCMAHARRRFEKALDTDRELAEYALSVFQRLYAIERRGRELSANERRALRREEAGPLLESFRAWLRRTELSVLPKSPMGQATSYMLKHWKALTRYLDDGVLSIDNNHTERCLRQVVLGRKNYMFAGSEGGVENSAVIYSFVASCKRNGIDPFEYFRDILIRMDEHPSGQLHRLLPANWKALVEETGPARLPGDEVELTPPAQDA